MERERPLVAPQWTFGWYVTAPFTTPAASALPWEDRALMTDAVWQPGYVRPRAFGAPWETVILLAQESPPVGVWINVPVEVRRPGLRRAHAMPPCAATLRPRVIMRRTSARTCTSSHCCCAMGTR